MEVKSNNQELNRSSLLKLALSRVTMFLALYILLLFVPAWTWRYWQAWVYLVVLIVPMLLVIKYLLKNDPRLMERRMRMREKRKEQKWIIVLSWIAFLPIFLLPGFDIRYGWSNLPWWVCLGADIFMLTGYFLFSKVLKTNTFTSRIIEVEKGQKVISSGPYAVVRHPMYVAVLIIYLFSPLALGSFWALVPFPIMILTLIIRILDEEKALTAELEGYKEYTKKTKYRLVPGLW